MKPFLKWAGNKYRCIEHVLNSLPQGRRLIEPFTGSGAVFLNSDYEQYLLGESNKDLVMLYGFLQQEGETFINYCAKFFHPKHNNAKQYYQFRDKFNHSRYGRRRAALFLYLNRHGYNGLCRYNLKGGFNVPFGSYKSPYFPRQEMLNFHHKSHLSEFLHSDFRDTFKQAKSGDIIYCDPPYVPLSKSASFTSYTNRSFKEQEQLQLVELALNAASRGIPTIISNHDTPFTRHHYQDSKIDCFEVKRSISCVGNRRIAAKELIAIFH